MSERTNERMNDWMEERKEKRGGGAGGGGGGDAAAAGNKPVVDIIVDGVGTVPS